MEPGHFLQEIFLTTYYMTACSSLPPLETPGLPVIRRWVFRNSVGSSAGKALRWKLETVFGTHLQGHQITRNSLLNESVNVFQNRSTTTTDILHEYFIPVKCLEVFLTRLRLIIPAHQVDLLNVTIRFVTPDQESFLRYADQEMFALVMLFHQPRTQQADQKMAAMTRALIDAALEVRGRYYLPYRLHATIKQFHRAYPQGQAFFALKRKYDPEELFQNETYRKYGLLTREGED